MHFDVHFWEGVCFFIFVAIVYKPIKNALSSCLNEYSNSVEQQIRDAENLREDAEKTFKYYTDQHKTFVKRISSMHKHTKENIQLLKNQATKILDEKIKIRQRLQKEKLGLYEKKEISETKETIIKKAMVLAGFYIDDVITPSLTKDEITQLLNTVKNKSITFH